MGLLISERDKHRMDNPLHPAIQLLDKGIQRLLRQEAQDQCRVLQ